MDKIYFSWNIFTDEGENDFFPYFKNKYFSYLFL